MDFEYTPEQEAFRKEFRRWLEANLPPELCLDDAADDRVPSDRETYERRRAWQKGEQRTSEREEDRIGRADTPRPRGQDHGREEETQKVFQSPHTTIG